MISKMINFYVYKYKKKSTLYFTLFSILLSAVNVSYGQIYYKSSYQHGVGNPGGLNTEKDDILDNSWTVVSGVGYTNNWTSMITIPFPFEFYGNPVNSLKASFHGLITFSSSNLLPDPNINLPASNLPDNTICVLWDTYVPPNYYSYYYGEIATKTFGTTPNRQFWITWKDWPIGLTESNYFACVLEETTNNIYIVDKYILDTWTVPQVTATVGVQLNNTTASQYGKDTIVLTSPGSIPDDNNYYLFEPTPYPANDAGITNLSSPSTTILPGTETIEVTLKNFGTDDLDSVRINWSINGTQQTPVYWSGPSIVQNSTTNVVLGTYAFTSGFHTLKAWTELPNGNLDGLPLNDEFEVSICTPFQGTYTVGGPNADFDDVSEAVDALDCGITGPVTFNVTNDYFGKLHLQEVQGASATNTITFDGGSPKARIIHSTGTGDYAVIEMNGVDHVTFKNFIISNLNFNGGTGVYLWQGADNNTFYNCNLSHGYSPYYYNYTNNIGFFAACNYLTVEECTIYDASTSIKLSGSSSNHAIGNRLINNYMYSIQEGVNAVNQDSLEIIGNALTGFNQYAIIDASNLNQFKINKNDCYSSSVLWQSQSGIYIYGSSSSTNSNSEFSNNMVIGNLDFAGLHKTNIFHNTVYSEQVALVLNYGTNTELDVRNNIFATSDYNTNCVEINDLNSIISLDYNLYYNTKPNSSITFLVQGTNYNSLASLQAAFPQFNVNSIVQDPMFIDPADDLHLQPNPTINNLALPLQGVTDDIDGDARPSPNEIAVDMGADEIASSSFVDIAITDFESPVSDTICAIDSIPIIVTIHNLAGPVNNVIVDASISGIISGTFTRTIPVLYSNQVQDIVLGKLPANGPGSFSLSATVTHPLDSSAVNDTIQKQVILNDTIQATTISTNETAAGANDGAITIQSIMGGAPPYSILWSTGQTTMSISNLSPNSYSVQITNGYGCTTIVMDTINAYIPTNTIENDQQAEITIHPNPANGLTTLSVTLNTPTSLTITIFNNIGQELRTILSPPVHSEDFKLDLSSLENGIYLVKVSIENQIVTRKLIVYR